jgi:hypothetical protein
MHEGEVENDHGLRVEQTLLPKKDEESRFCFVALLLDDFDDTSEEKLIGPRVVKKESRIIA